MALVRCVSSEAPHVRSRRAIDALSPQIDALYAPARSQWCRCCWQVNEDVSLSEVLRGRWRWRERISEPRRAHRGAEEERLLGRRRQNQGMVCAMQCKSSRAQSTTMSFDSLLSLYAEVQVRVTSHLLTTAICFYATCNSLPGASAQVQVLKYILETGVV